MRASSNEPKHAKNEPKNTRGLAVSWADAMRKGMPAGHQYAALGVRAAGSLLGIMFGAVGVLRQDKPLHPRGLVYDALIRRTGSTSTWGCRWLDEAGNDAGRARLSRSAGLPAPAPDIHGLAITFTGDDGRRHDLLLATTGLGRWGRFILIPRSEPYTCSYGSLFPYRTPNDLVHLAAAPITAFDPHASPVMTFRLQAAGTDGGWDAFGTLELSAPEDGVTDRPLRFDPVAYPLPDLHLPVTLQRLREPAYVAARRTPARVRWRE